MKKILFAALALISITACKQKGGGDFTVSGKIRNPPSQKIFLQEIPFDRQQPVILDSGSIASNGTFSLHALAKEEGLYRVVVENGPDVLLVNDAKDIKLEMDVNHYRSYKVTGSAATGQLHDLFEQYRVKDSVLYLAFMQLDTLHKQNASDSLVKIAEAKRDAEMKAMNAIVTDFINKSDNGTATYYAIGMASRTMQQEELVKLSTAAADKFKTHRGLAILKSMLTVQNKPQQPSYALMGQQAPEIAMPDTKGVPFKLSSLKGKYVLVDFWASWCAPCRKENPNVVAAYNKFKDKNFTILGVSLDEDKASWEAAIKEDKLNWTHISDLKHWQSAVVPAYQIEGIPFNVLLDPQGKIIASSLRGEELERKLAEVLK
ncbi:TlpA disulfide reductase family protein [Sediminibacterium soli]|uniref:TlpA disulfide reductase family protein n=1 Tax=Sediminibacterium soli TaxID=2698829 RepID=UPI00137AA25C|nr:TlpA disulfide reductase family protein [Sediminibacterium soli]NCI47594.1 AhpC/TSA family protein [Sediminibacterium soli]